MGFVACVHVASPRGTEVTRGADLTYSYILYIILNMYRSPVYRETNYQYPLTVIFYIVSIFFHFFGVGLKSHRFI